MRAKVVIGVLVVLLAIIWVRQKFKEHGISLGKLVKPPKVRIVYSKKLKPSERPKIQSSRDAVNVLRQVWSKQTEVREEMVMMLLDRSNRVLGYHLLSQGGISATVADMRLLYSVALQSLASNFILAHNHPSGNTQPSNADKQLTRNIQEAGELLDSRLASA